MLRQVDDLRPFGVSSWRGAGAFPKQLRPCLLGRSELVEEFLVGHKYILMALVTCYTYVGMYVM